MMWNGDYTEMTDRPTQSVVCDAGPLIHLDELNGLWMGGYGNMSSH